MTENGIAVMWYRFLCWCRACARIVLGHSGVLFRPAELAGGDGNLIFLSPGVFPRLPARNSP